MRPDSERSELLLISFEKGEDGGGKLQLASQVLIYLETSSQHLRAPADEGLVWGTVKTKLPV